MVMVTSCELVREGKPWPVIVRRIVICAVVGGVLFGLLTGSWEFGSLLAATVVGIPLVCVALSALWGAIVIPPTMLVMRWLGVQSPRKGETTRAPDK
jgi:hypothetical protein